MVVDKVEENVKETIGLYDGIWKCPNRSSVDLDDEDFGGVVGDGETNGS